MAHQCLESLKIMIYITGFSVLLILFIQSLHRKIPTATLEQLYIPTLNETTTAIKNTTIYFDLKLYNKNPVGIYYRTMNLTFSYFPNKSSTTSVPLSVYTIPAFHQPHHKILHVRDKVVTVGLVVHPAVDRVVVLRVDLLGRVKFKSIAQWKRTVKVGVDVAVDKDTGEKVMKSGIHLVHSGGAPVAGGALGICLPAMLLIFICVINLRLL